MQFYAIFILLRGARLQFTLKEACKNKNDNFHNLVLSGTLAREAALNVRCWSQNECPLREIRKILSIVRHGCICCLCGFNVNTFEPLSYGLRRVPG